MCSKDDFLDWDELDLDILLVDYTDYDDAFTTDSVNTDSTIEYTVPDEYFGGGQAKEVVKRKPKVVRRPFIYSCPVCIKKLRSPSGFRGHILKKHPAFSRNSFRGKKNKYALLLGNQ
jgi:hypothetical protein